MHKLEVVNEGVIYRNPNPGYQYVYASHSHPVQLSETELVCTYQRGQALYSTDLIFAFSRSTDGGITWQEEPLVIDRTRDALPYSYHDPFLSCTSDGALVIAAFRVDRSDASRPMFNEATGGLAEVENILIRSDDNGRTWSTPEVLKTPPGMLITPTSPLMELGDGTWFLPFDQWHGFDEMKAYEPRMLGLFSHDCGRTWGEPVTIADGAAQGKGFWHGKIIQLADNRLFALSWSAEMPGARDLPLHCSFGSADGHTWSTPEATNIPGQTNWPVALDGSTLSAIYTSRESAQPGFFVTLSEDGGANWDIENRVCVWDATGRDKLGVSALEAYPRSHDTIAFGAPTAMRLLNGDIFVSFWCTEMSITHIRYARLRVAG